jgi:hypothetical protein
MPTFVYPALLWGLPVVGVPVLIHLINVLRHRQVDWAAMEFLFASQKKNRTWIFLKQLLLLLLRMAAIAAVVLMVAKPRASDQLGAWFSTGKTHHIVVLDDSFSMSDRWSDTSAWEQGKSVIARIGDRVAKDSHPQTLTLLRFSQAARTATGTRPDLLDEPVDSRFGQRLRDILAKLEVSQTAVGPQPALETILQLLGDPDDSQRLVYLLSDFRTKEWNEPGELKAHLKRLREADAELRLIRCVDKARPNLAVTGLVPGAGIHATGVPLSMEVTVANFGQTSARDVPVLLETDGHQRPAMEIEEILPGKSVTERFPVQFPTAGEHTVVARLDTDAVAVDNARYAVVDLPQELPVLLIDTDPNANNARYLQAALAPGGAVSTGIGPRIERPRFLSLNPLDTYRTIYLCDVDYLDPSAVEALQQYVASGGGLVFFLGERSQSAFINEVLYKDDQGLFPLPVAGPAQLLVDRLRKAPDLEVTDHPVFKVLAGTRNSFISTVLVERYFAVPESWNSDRTSATQVIARLRNGAPLVAERRFGEGRVVAFLTTAAPVWNNWARGNPSFVVAMLELQAFMAGPESGDAPHVVGAPLEFDFDSATHDNSVRFTPPDKSAIATSQAVTQPDGRMSVTLAKTESSGIYQASLRTKNGESQVRRFAVNVEPQEGDLTLVPSQALAARLEGVDYDFVEAGTFQYEDGEERDAGDLGQALLYALVLILIGEQLLAWSASYHPPVRKASQASGGAG